MSEPSDPEPTLDMSAAPADSLDAGLAAGFGRPAGAPGSVLAGLRSTLGPLPPVVLREAEGESALVVTPRSDALAIERTSATISTPGALSLICLITSRPSFPVAPVIAMVMTYV